MQNIEFFKLNSDFTQVGAGQQRVRLHTHSTSAAVAAETAAAETDSRTKARRTWARTPRFSGVYSTADTARPIWPAAAVRRRPQSFDSSCDYVIVSSHRSRCRCDSANGFSD